MAVKLEMILRNRTEVALELFNKKWAFFRYRFTNSLISNHFHPQLSRSDRDYYIVLTFQIRDE